MGDVTSRTNLTKYGTQSWRENSGSVAQQMSPNRHRVSCEKALWNDQTIKMSNRFTTLTPSMGTKMSNKKFIQTSTQKFITQQDRSHDFSLTPMQTNLNKSKQFWLNQRSQSMQSGDLGNRTSRVGLVMFPGILRWLLWIKNLSKIYCNMLLLRFWHNDFNWCFTWLLY